MEWEEVKMTEVERGGNAKSEGQQKASREERERTQSYGRRGGGYSEGRTLVRG